MRHNVAFCKLGRNTAHRAALLKNLTISLFTHERIRTTLQKAKELRSYAEKIITLAKQDTLHARRQAYAKLGSHQLVQKLFGEIAPVYAQRPGGYTRIYRLGERRGDNGQLALIELVDREPQITAIADSARKSSKAPAKAKKAAGEKPVKEAKAPKAPKAPKEPKAAKAAHKMKPAKAKSK